MELPPFAAVVLAGGTARRLGGVDKAALEVGGRPLLDRALAAVAGAAATVVVGDPVAVGGEVVFAREEPRHGGPAAALLAGRDALPRPMVAAVLVVLACDMPLVTADTVRRLCEAGQDHDGAALTGPDGRRQLALSLDLGRLDAAAPPPGERAGLPLHRLLDGLDLVAVRARGGEHRDVDTWTDLRSLDRPGLDGTGPVEDGGPSNCG